MAELEEDQSYLDDLEVMLLDVDSAEKLECEAMNLNIMAKLTKSYPCSQCNHVVGESKHKQCGACGEVVHVACLPGKPPVGYWFCKECAAALAHGHADPALNVHLHDLIRGGNSYPDSSEEMR